jgi:DnaK suppressor protein
LPRKTNKKKETRRRPAAPPRKQVSPGKKKYGKKELSEFRKLLIKRKEEIADNINHISEETLKKSQKDASGDISGYSYHMADVATDTYDREFSLGLASNERELLYELDDSIKRIDEGTYGLCEDCKSAIAKTRLKAIPHARFCLQCQEKKEKR